MSSLFTRSYARCKLYVQTFCSEIRLRLSAHQKCGGFESPIVEPTRHQNQLAPTARRFANCLLSAGAGVVVLSCVWSGAAHAVAPNIPASCIWYADKDAIYQVAVDTNQVSKTIALDKAHNLAMNGSDCGVWAVAGKQLFKFDANGVQTQKIALKSLSKKLDNSTQSVVDPDDGSVWLTDNKTLVHVDVNGQLVATWTAPGNITSLMVALDQTVWIFDRKQLWHYSPQGTLLSTQDLHKLLDPDPKYAALDMMGEVLWLAGGKQLTQIRLNQTNPLGVQITLPDKANALDINQRTGQVWLATDKTLLSYGADGKPGYVTDLKALNLRNASQFAFDSATQSLWLAADKAIGRLSAQGALIASMTEKKADLALAVPAFMLTPTVSLIRPPSDTVTNNPTPTISYAYNALCNNQPCGFVQDDFSDYTLAATLNQIPIGPFVYDKISGQASFTPTGRLPEGNNTLVAQATDENAE